jgi:hypothetical protein
MFSSISFAALAATLSLTFANATPAGGSRLRVRDSYIENEYIVKLKDRANITSHISSLPFAFSVEDTNSPVTHWWPDDFFKGYGGTFEGAARDAILASPDVKYVKKNSIVCRMSLSLSHVTHTKPHHRSASLVYKPPHRGTSKPSTPESPSAARTQKLPLELVQQVECETFVTDGYERTWYLDFSL